MKARVETAYGEWVERIPAWVKWATQVFFNPSSTWQEWDSCDQ